MDLVNAGITVGAVLVILFVWLCFLLYDAVNDRNMARDELSRCQSGNRILGVKLYDALKGKQLMTDIAVSRRQKIGYLEERLRKWREWHLEMLGEEENESV